MSHVSEPARPTAVAANAFLCVVSLVLFCVVFVFFFFLVSIIATDGPAGVAGLTCSAVCVVCVVFLLLLACVHGKSAANAVLKSNGVMSVNCLRTDQSDLSQAFAGVGRLTTAERFALGAWDVLATGAPCNINALAAFDCEIVDVRDVGTHSLFIAKVVATSLRDGGEPLVFQRNAYATTRKHRKNKQNNKPTNTTTKRWTTAASFGSATHKSTTSPRIPLRGPMRA